MARRASARPVPPPRIHWAFTDGIHTFPNFHKADPDTIGNALKEIADAHGGHLKPADVEDAARNRAHPLHPHVTWDDSAAARNWRLQECRMLIRCVVLVNDDDDIEPPTRHWLSVDDPPDGRSYRSSDEIIKTTDLQLALLRRALRDLEAFEERYRQFKELCALVKVARSHAQAALGGAASGTQPSI